MSITDTFIRATIEHCFPTKTVGEKFKLRKFLAGAIEDRMCGSERYCEPVREALRARLMRDYNKRLHQHLRAEVS